MGIMGGLEVPLQIQSERPSVRKQPMAQNSNRIGFDCSVVTAVEVRQGDMSQVEAGEQPFETSLQRRGGWN